MDEQSPDKTPATESAPDSVADESKLDAAKQKLASLAEMAKEHDFKGDARKAAEGVKNLAENLKQRDFKDDARKAAEGVKNLKESLKTHDFKAELRDAFAETKKNPASLWKKPETLRPGKDLAVVGLAASVVLLLLLLVTSNSFLGLVCLVLGLGALLFSALGLKTEGRKLAVGGSVVGLLVVLCALGQTFGSSSDGEGDASVASADAGDAAAPSDKTAAAAKPDAAPAKKNATPMVGSKPKDYPVLVANEGKKTGKAEKIIANAAENAAKLNSLNFFGFHTGMSLADFKTLREHYGLTKDQLWCYFNVENGEVFRMCFTTKALDKIAGWPSNFDTVELQMLRYFGIVEWNNIKEVIKGEIDSIFQSDEERLLFGDADNVPRQYRTADGVVAKLFPKGWDRPAREVFDLLDTERQKLSAPIFRRFEQKNRMRKRLQELADQGVKVKMLQLPTDYEWLLREFDAGIWISAFPMTRDEFAWLFYDIDYDHLNKKVDFDIKEGLQSGNAFAYTFNALPAENKGSIMRFREPFPEEMKKAFESGIVDEKKYKEGYGSKLDKANPAVIVGDEASSGQMERRAMYIIHDGGDNIANAAWVKYEEERNALIKQGKSDAELAALGYGMNYKEWSRSRKDQEIRAYVEGDDGTIVDGLMFIAIYTQEEREAIEAKRKAEREAKEKEEAKKATIESNNGRCEAVKKALDAANIENTTIELPDGVHLLMTRVNLTAGEETIDWASTFEVTKAQRWAVLTAKEHWKNSWLPGKGGAAPDILFESYEASAFINDLNSVAPAGWRFRLASNEAWDALSGGVRFQPDSLKIRPNTLEAKKQGKKLDDLQWKVVPVYAPTQNFDSQSRRDAAAGSLRQDECKSVGNGTPNYYGLCDMLDNAIEMHQPIWGRDRKVGRSGEGAMRLVATYTPPEQSVAAGAEKTPEPAASKNDNAQ